MLKRPSSRRKSHSQTVELNLVPILDTMVTLIGFLLYTTSFLVLVSIESPLPQASPEQVQEQIKEKPLQLTVTVREKDVEIWSPFQKIAPQSIPNTPEGAFDTKRIHEALIEIKKQFPKEVTAVIVPLSNSSYHSIMNLMDSIRTLEPSDPPLYLKNEQTQVDEPMKNLFPKIIFGNLLGDD